METLVRNEQTKLLATALNNLAVATIVTGFIGPIAASLYELPNAAHRGWWFLIAAGWFTAGVILHIFGAMILRRIRL